MMGDDERAELRSAEPAIWDDGDTLSPDQTKDTKVHLTLRVDAEIYRQLLRYKRQHKKRTVTAAIEILLRKGLAETDDHVNGDDNVDGTVAHILYQDQILAVLARNVHIESEQDRTFVERFLQNSAEFGRSPKEPS